MQENNGIMLLKEIKRKYLDLRVLYLARKEFKCEIITKTSLEVL